MDAEELFRQTRTARSLAQIRSHRLRTNRIIRKFTRSDKHYYNPYGKEDRQEQKRRKKEQAKEKQAKEKEQKTRKEKTPHHPTKSNDDEPDSSDEEEERTDDEHMCNQSSFMLQVVDTSDEAKQKKKKQKKNKKNKQNKKKQQRKSSSSLNSSLSSSQSLSSPSASSSSFSSSSSSSFQSSISSASSSSSSSSTNSSASSKQTTAKTKQKEKPEHTESQKTTKKNAISLKKNAKEREDEEKKQTERKKKEAEQQKEKSKDEKKEEENNRTLQQNEKDDQKSAALIVAKKMINKLSLPTILQGTVLSDYLVLDTHKISQELDLLRSSTEFNGKEQESNVHFVCARALGKGGFSRCYQFDAFQIANNAEKKKGYGSFAAKVTSLEVIKRKSSVVNQLKNEIYAHSRLKHPNIVQYHGSFYDSKNLYILMELCSSGSLLSILQKRGRFEEVEVLPCMWQICNALKYMHSLHIVNGDIKLGNILVNEAGHIKLCDFGFASISTTSPFFEAQEKAIKHWGNLLRGTPNYVSREMVMNQTGPSLKSDIWALGIVFYALLVGFPPFETEHVVNTYQRIIDHDLRFPPFFQEEKGRNEEKQEQNTNGKKKQQEEKIQKESFRLSEEAMDLISRLLAKEPDDRPTISQVLEHPFFSITKQTTGKGTRVERPVRLERPSRPTSLSE